MPDEEGNTAADKDNLPKSPLHAYKEGREDDVEGDVQNRPDGDPNDPGPGNSEQKA
jgi:hypothetical protein